MANESLARLASLLGHSCKASAGKHDDVGTLSSIANSSLIVSSHCKGDGPPATPARVGEDCTLTFPSFSLQRLCEESEERTRAASPSREEVQMKASTMMSRQLVATIDMKTGEGLTSSSSSSPPQIMVTNLLNSFDQLVDARIRAYSKILRNHYLSISNVKWGRDEIMAGSMYPTDSAAQVIAVEYKLRKLVEFGSNLSFGSIATSFTPRATAAATATDGAPSSSLPVLLTVVIDLPSLSESRHRESRDILHDDGTNKNPFPIKKLSFQAPGVIQGTFYSSFSPNGNNDESAHTAAPMTGTDDARTDVTNNVPPGGGTTCSSNTVSIEVDCEVLLSNMMEEASRVVGMVVEHTNKAWAKWQQEQTTAEASASVSPIKAMCAKGGDEESSGSGNKVSSKPSVEFFAKRNRSSHDHAVSRSPKLGAKKVSEISFDPMQLEVGAEDGEDVQEENNDDTNKSAPSCCKRSMVDHPPVNRDPNLDFSDDENLNPHISAEKASHIVDYVFGELDDAAIIPTPHPSPNKRARTDDDECGTG